MRLFLEKAYKLSQEWGGIPVLLAGDLNSSPNVRSSIVIFDWPALDYVYDILFNFYDLRPFYNLSFISSHLQSALYQFLASSEVRMNSCAFPDSQLCRWLAWHQDPLSCTSISLVFLIFYTYVVVAICHSWMSVSMIADIFLASLQNAETLNFRIGMQLGRFQLSSFLSTNYFVIPKISLLFTGKRIGFFRQICICGNQWL